MAAYWARLFTQEVTTAVAVPATATTAKDVEVSDAMPPSVLPAAVNT
jgi:hypothetical protein